MSKCLEGVRTDGTDCGGPLYIHERSNKYRENFDRIFRKCECKDCKCDKGESCCREDK